MSKRTGRKERPPRGKRIWRGIKIVGALLLIVFNISIVFGSFFAMRQLDEAAKVVPELPKIMDEIIDSPSVIVSADGVTLHTVAAEYREPVRIENIPNVVIDATLAAEDIRFYTHPGIDFIALARISAAFAKDRDFTAGGASTLTMQLSKRVLTGTEQTVERKIKDMALAIMIERMLTKDQILELYLNQVFFGSGAYGIKAAAEVYFGKELEELTVAEAALLARCVRRPSTENPFANLDKAIENRNIVLRLMRDADLILESEYQEAINEEVNLREDRVITLAGHKTAEYFVDHVLATIQRELPEVDLSRGGYRVETTLVYEYQKITEAGVAKHVAQNSGLNVTTGAFVVLDNDGRILSLVGGRDYNRNQFNIVTQGRRQPGSAFKPFVYATAFEFGVLTPGGSISNEPFFYRMPDGSQRRVRGGGSGGQMSIVQAMASSVNTPAVRALDRVGANAVVQASKRAYGFSHDLPAVPSLALGSGEVSMIDMAQAYSVFQNEGDRVTPYPITRVIAPDGTVVKRYLPNRVRRVVSVNTAKGTDTLLWYVVQQGTGRTVRSVANARGKTGTTNDFRDAWFCGYTDQLIAIGWFGNEVGEERPDGTMRWRYLPMRGVFGGQRVAPMWADIVGQIQGKIGEERRTFTPYFRQSRAYVNVEPTTPAEPQSEQPSTIDDLGNGEFPDTVPPIVDPPPPPAPSGSEDSTMVEICADSGLLSTIYCPERVIRAFRSGSAPRNRCTIHGSH